MALVDFIGASVPEPLSDAAYRRAARALIWIHVFLAGLNTLACSLAPLNPKNDLRAVGWYLAVNLPAHACVIACNLWLLLRAASPSGMRAATRLGAAFGVNTVISSLWLSGSVTSWNYLWLVLLIFSYRIYFDAAIGRFVLAAVLVQYVVLIALELGGVLTPHALLAHLPLLEYTDRMNQMTAAVYIAVICVLSFLGANYAANRIRGSEHALTELNRTLEERVKRQVAALEKVGRLRRYLAPQVVERLLASDVDPGSVRERRPITVLFADLKGFTPMTESLSSEVLAALLMRYFEVVAEIAFRHGGTIDKFIGDAVMIFFGAPEATSESDQAIRCVQLALEVQRRLAELGDEFLRLGASEPLQVRIGIASGVATVGEFGAQHRTDFTAVGVPVNRAARLEPLAPPGGVLVDDSTRILLGAHGVCASFGEHRLKGFSQPQAAFLVDRLQSS